MKALNEFLREVHSRSFKWGVWDCLIFTNEAWRRMHGEGWADDWVGRYLVGKRPMTFPKLLIEFQASSVEDALQSRLTRASKVPPRGALVLGGEKIITASGPGIKFGICVGSSAAFLSGGGVVYYPIEYIDSAWVRNDAA